MQSFSVFGVGPVEAQSVSNVTATNTVTPGEVWMYKGEEYLYVYNAGVQQISQGQFAVLSANSGYSVTVSSVTQYDVPIGFVKHTTITTGAYGWLLTRGFTPIALTASNSATTSDVLIPGAGGLCAVMGQSTSFTTGAMYNALGYVVQGAASAASGGTASAAVAYVRCFGS